MPSLDAGSDAGYAPGGGDRARTGPLDARQRRIRGWLLVIALIAAPWLAPAPVVRHADVAIAPVAPDTDYLFAQPADGIEGVGLARVLDTLGFAATRADLGARVRVGPGGDPSAVAARLAGTGLVRSVEPDAVVRAASGPTAEPDDPQYAARQREYLAAIRAPQAWATETGNPGVTIAVIDTGVDFNHPDLLGRLAVNFRDAFLNGRDDDGSGCADDIAGCSFVSLATADPSCGYTQPPPHWRAFDDEGHGSFVAGIAAAAGDNGRGIAGVAWDVRILPVKVLDCTATGRISDAAAGIRYAATMGADVINISFGTPSDSPALREAIASARARGAVIVASAGNDGRPGVTYPAAYPGVLSVAASGARTEAGIDYTTIAEFANFGPGVDFIAPGVDLLSTVPAHLCGHNRWRCIDGPYGPGSGSSFATPVVAGAVALLLAHQPDRSPDFVAHLLLNTRRQQPPGNDGRLVDLQAAVERGLFTTGAPGTSKPDTPKPGGPPSPPGPGGP